MEKLYYISQGVSLNDHLVNIQNVCEAGCKLVQLRLKNFTQDQYNETALKAKEICESYDSILIINDNIEAAIYSNANGIHLGKNDQSPVEARTLTSDKIIGGTANTLEDCLSLIEQKVDYIGLGPFKHTTTKKVLSPILGIVGFKEIQNELNRLGHTTPIYAIGGITTENISDIIDAGIYGVAVSGILSKESEVELKSSIEKIKLALLAEEAIS